MIQFGPMFFFFHSSFYSFLVLDAVFVYVKVVLVAVAHVAAVK